MLGDNMTLEVCFKRTHDKSSDTGVVLVGHHNLQSDRTEYRLFMAGGYLYGDCGKGQSYTAAGGRNYYSFTDQSSWHIAKFPVYDGSSNVMMLDGKTTGRVSENQYVANGDFGVQASKLCVFTDALDPAASQKAAIRYLNVWKYGTNELLFSGWPDPARNGLIDIISMKCFEVNNGSVKIVDW